MASLIRVRLLSAASVMACGSSPRLTQPLMISSAWIGCSSSYLACSSSHHRPRGPIFSFLASPRSAFSELLCATPSPAYLVPRVSAPHYAVRGGRRAQYEMTHRDPATPGKLGERGRAAREAPRTHDT